MRKFGLFIVILWITVGPVMAQDATEEPAPYEPIVIEMAGILPEGVEYDAVGERFLFGSLSQGTIFQISESGEPEPFIEDEALSSTVGIQVDVANNRLLVTNSEAAVFSDPEALGMAALAAYDLETGESLFRVDLGALLPEARHFANDVAVDEEGNAYVTDSFSPVIYKVDMAGNAEVFFQDEQLGNAEFGLNGIDYHLHGFLLVALSGTGTIFKIPVDDPTQMAPVQMEVQVSIDGMIISNEGKIIAVARASDGEGAQELLEITSEDEWETAAITNRAATTNEATTVTLRDGVPYYINIYFGNPASETYEIVPVMFEETE